jgi:hypothetical protein
MAIGEKTPGVKDESALAHEETRKKTYEKAELTRGDLKNITAGVPTS